MPFKTTGDGGNGGGAAPADMDAFVLDKWQPFAEDQGFVANRAPVVGTAPARQVWTHKGSIGVPEPPYVFMQTAADSLLLYTGTGIDTGEADPFDQPGNPNNGPVRSPRVNNSDGPWTGHYLFANGSGDSDYIHAVAQIGARQWRHFLYGVIPDANKYGTWTGGDYVFGMNWDQTAAEIDDPFSGLHSGLGTMFQNNEFNGRQFGGFVRCENLVTSVEWFANTVGAINATGQFSDSAGGGQINPQTFLGQCYAAGGALTIGGSLKRLGASLISRNVVLVPVTIFANNVFSGNPGVCALGTIPDVYFINMRGLTPGGTITVGSDTYRVFPLVNSNTVDTAADEEYSGYEGLAYRVIP